MKLLSVMLAAFLTFGLVCSARAEDKPKSVTLKGDICCAKCELGKEKKCATVIVVKDGDKEKVYYFDSKSDKKHHSDFCLGRKEGSVTGTVAEKDGKNIVTVTKLAKK